MANAAITCVASTLANWPLILVQFVELPPVVEHVIQRHIGQIRLGLAVTS